MLEFLQGYLPNPIGILSFLGAKFQEYQIYNLSIMIGVALYLGIAAYQMLTATATLRKTLMAGLVVRSILVGAALSAAPYIRDGTFYMWSTAYAGATTLGSRLIDDSMAEGALLVGISTAGVGIAGLAGKFVFKATEVAAEAAEKGLLATGEKMVRETASNQTAKAALKQGLNAMNYMNVFGLLLIPVIISFTAIVVLSGVLLMLANLLFPALVATMVASPMTGLTYFGNWVRAFLGSYATVLITPLIFGIASAIAIGAPSARLNAELSRSWDSLQTTLNSANLANIFNKMPEILGAFGGLIGATLVAIVGLVVGVIIATMLTNNAGRYISQLVEGSFGGGSLAETGGVGVLLSRLKNPALTLGKGAGALAGGAASMATAAGRFAVGAPATAARDARLRQSSAENPFPNTPARPYNPHSLDYLKSSDKSLFDQRGYKERQFANERGGYVPLTQPAEERWQAKRLREKSNVREKTNTE